jgi:hypothetical protein
MDSGIVFHNNFGLLHTSQGKLDEAEKMYSQVQKGYVNGLGSIHVATYISTLNTIKERCFTSLVCM